MHAENLNKQLKLVDAGLRRAAPNLRDAIWNKFTMPVQETFSGAAYTRSVDPEGNPGPKPPKENPDPSKKQVPYLSLGTSVSMRNGSTLGFENLREEDYERLGGVEYQALRALMWLIPGVRSRSSVPRSG